MYSWIWYRSRPWRLHCKDEVIVIGRSWLKWICPYSICSHQGHSSGKKKNFRFTCFSFCVFFSLFWCGCYLCFRSMMMRSNCGLWRPLLPNWLIAKWIRWMKLWLWGLCYALSRPLYCTSLVRHSLLCTNVVTLLMFTCSRCTDRVFGQHQWETLRTKLTTWRVNYLFCFS